MKGGCMGNRGMRQERVGPLSQGHCTGQGAVAWGGGAGAQQVPVLLCCYVVEASLIAMLLFSSRQVMSDSFVTPWAITLPGSSVHVILQAKTLEWVAMPFSRGSS